MDFKNISEKSGNSGRQRLIRYMIRLFGDPFYYSFLKRQILDSSKLKEFADDNFELNESGRKVSKWIENTVGKGEIGHNEPFLLFPQCFQKACTADT